MEKSKQKFTNTLTTDDENVKEEIVDEVDEMAQQNRISKAGDPLTTSDQLAAMSGGISSSGANAIDHSIDTLQLDQYDYVEEVRLN